jgi:hypothetical protein
VTFFREKLPPRPLNLSAHTALPLYVQEQGARVSKSGEVLVIETEVAGASLKLSNCRPWSLV